MKNVHLICNAHLDPVWLWKWEEGCTEALSTFRTASQLIDEFPGFVFNHNESILYQWVKENDPILFEEIKAKVKAGTWHIMGGWYIQPDCNMPAGESFVRNIMTGRTFFREEFDQSPTTAINFDSFGHSKGLVQILKQAGYDSYLVCRPAKNGFPFAEQDFLWKGLDGSEIVVHRSDENYNSIWGHAAEELKTFLPTKEAEEVTLVLWGVGDHGGGPSRKDLSDLKEMIEAAGDEYRILHSSPENYFRELGASGTVLPVVDKGLNPVAPGCYTSQIRVKQKHRQLENELYSSEKMESAAMLAGLKPYDNRPFKAAELDLLFSEFHDALPGSGSQLVEEDTLRQLDHGLQEMSQAKLKAALALSAGQAPVLDGTSTVLVYNPHPYPVSASRKSSSAHRSRTGMETFCIRPSISTASRCPPRRKRKPAISASTGVKKRQCKRRSHHPPSPGWMFIFIPFPNARHSRPFLSMSLSVSTTGTCKSSSIPLQD